jgi:hypothetical protein
MSWVILAKLPAFLRKTLPKIGKGFSFYYPVLLLNCRMCFTLDLTHNNVFAKLALPTSGIGLKNVMGRWTGLMRHGGPAFGVSNTVIGQKHNLIFLIFLKSERQDEVTWFFGSRRAYPKTFVGRSATF